MHLKRKILIALPLLTLLTLLAFRDQDPILLRLNLEKGATYSYQTDITQQVTTQIGGQSMPSQMNMGSVMDVVVTGKYKQDSTLLLAKFQRMTLGLTGMGKDTQFDSRDTTRTGFTGLNKFYGALKANPVTIKTNAEGKILEIRGLDRLRQAAKDSMGGHQDASIQKVMDGFLGDQAFGNNFTNLGLFPEKPVSAGDHWDRAYTMNNLIPMNVTTTYTLREIHPDSVLVDLSSKMISSRDTAFINGIAVPGHVTGTQTGTYTVQRGTGLVSRGHLHQDMTMTLSMMGQHLDIRTKGDIQVIEGIR